jgi:hypothetical protein
MRKLFVVAAILSAACSGSGTSNPPVPDTAATPTFSVAAGTKNAPISVVISTTTPGAAIHYTTNGVDPTAASSTYTTALAISTATTLKAIATASGFNQSAVATAAYAFQAATPTFSVAGGTYATSQSVAISTTTPGATVYYTTDGSAPTTSSTLYSGAISLTVSANPTTTTIKAIAVRTGFTGSDVASATYIIDSTATPAATPTFSPVAGTYPAAQNVTITCATGGATIYYTTDGSAPTVASAVYSAPVNVAASLTLKAIATASGHTTSAVGSAAYTINLPQAATPTFSPAAGSYSSAQSVTISSTTPGAVIHYTTNGSTPTAASTTYAGAIAVSATTTLKAIATATGYTDSAVATAAYTISSSGGGTDFPTLCADLQTALASLFGSCMKANPSLFTSPGPNSMGGCSDEQKEITAGRVTYDAGQGSACVAAVQSMTCASIDMTGGWALPASCQAAMVGQVATNGTCYASEDCANGYCTAGTTTCPGTCQPYAGLGASCATAECGPNLVCDDVSATCRTPSSTVGAACPCGAGLWCDSSGASPVCRASKTSGTCSYGNNGECALGYQCFTYDATGSHCLAISGSGGPCTANPCGYGYVCSSGTCRSWATVGQSCVGATLGGMCIGGYCDNTPTCVAYKANGAACTASSQCASGSCISGHCAPDSCVAP